MNHIVIKNVLSKIFISIIFISCSGPGFLVKAKLLHTNQQMDRLSTGGRKDSALSALSYPSMIFFESFWPSSKTVIFSPVASDLILQDDKRYETWFFYTKFQKKDGKASRDETTPYVFLNDKFFGKGWKTYDSISAK